MTRLPNFNDFLSLELPAQVDVLDVLFEHTDSLVWFTLQNKQFMSGRWSSYKEFLEAIRSRLQQVCDDTEKEGISSRGVDHLANIIGAHPRLGEPKAKLSEHSKREQSKLTGTGNNSPDVLAKLKQLNDKYESTYEGLKFVVFVNGRSYEQISKVMEQRINSGNTWFQECRLAVDQMVDIALDRLDKCSEMKGKI
ncbi:hypothetical protein C6P41_004170 [Kluyveromyces marxianus]|nr:hypothetical protein C6P43_001712 [Kluyveromyces marxianus]KAG0681724.1 hypothetical protein C6P41_004170 [Kluyveromyces marxianus]